MSDPQPDFTRLAELTAGLGLHQHLCLIYATKEEQFAAALPFLKAGLEQGEKCLYFADENTAAAVLDALRKIGTDFDQYLRSGALTITHKRETDLQQGRFNPDWWIGYLNQTAAEAMAAEFSALRILGDMDWALRGSNSVGKLIECESRINHFVRDHDARVICQYNRNCNAPELILGIIRTHPLVVYGGIVCKNPYYVPPDEFLKPNQAAQEVERLLNNILASERAEQALRDSEERFRKVFEEGPFGMSIVGLDNRMLMVNQALSTLLGYTKDELTGRTFSGITHPADRENEIELTKQAFAGTVPNFRIEKRLIRKNGDAVWVDLAATVIRAADGRPLYGLGMIEDITERKRAEEALRRSEAYLAAAQRLSRTGSWALNLSSRELYWSQETYRIFGFDPAKTTARLNETFLPRIHPEDRPRIEEDLKAGAIQRESYGVDYRIVLPDGSIKCIHDVVYPVANEVGDVVERYGVVMDVTDRKRTEEALQKSRDQLRALAARVQRIREEERTRVAREIHDELGQALTAIKIDLSSLNHELPADQKQQSESILQQVDETIQSVRRISTELRPAILDALGLTAAVEWAAEEFAARTGTHCRLDLPRDDIVIDPERATALFRIFQETLTNVARHAGATAVNVRLAQQNGHLTLEVHDNGRGVNEEQLSATSSLGILGMRERALLLGGELSIAGAPGEGTTVRVQVPVTHPTLPKDGK